MTKISPQNDQNKSSKWPK